MSIAPLELKDYRHPRRAAEDSSAVNILFRMAIVVLHLA